VWISGGDIFELRPVFGQIIQLIGIAGRILWYGACNVPWGPHDLRAGDPTVMVERVIAQHLEILRRVRRGSVRVLCIEGVHHADPLDWFLWDAVKNVRSLDAGSLQNCRHNVDHVMELVADTASILDRLRP